MVISRHRSDNYARIGMGTNRAIVRIRDGISNGLLSYTVAVLKEGQRLDHIAHATYGDGRLWWIIAAASNIGWWLQVPPGTRVRIPESLAQVEELI